MRRLSLFSAICCLSFPTVADSCDEYAAEIALDYAENIQKLQDDFSNSLNKAQQLYQRHQVDADVSFDMVADVWKQYFDYDTHHQRFTHEIHEVAVNLNTDPKTQKYCDDQDTIENWLTRRVNAYEKLLNQIDTSIHQRVELESISQDQGLTIISAYSYGVAPKISIVGEGLLNSFKIGPLVYDQHFEIRKLDAGEYRWDRVELGFNGFALQDSNMDVTGSTSYSFFDFTDEQMVFTVTPGKLNFAGVFIFESKGRGARADLHDRSAILIKMFEEQYPYLLNRYEWHNSLAPDDPFLSHYYEQRLSAGAAE